MNNAFKKYLFLIHILLISGFVNVYANTSIDTTSLIQKKNNSDHTAQTSIPRSTNHALDFSKENNKEKKTYKEFVDSETFEENDEDKIDFNCKPLSFGSSIAAIFYAQILDNLHCELQESKQRYIFNYSKISLRLHAKFQVFII